MDLPSIESIVMSKAWHGSHQHKSVLTCLCAQACSAGSLTFETSLGTLVDLAETSRESVRQALARLAADGFIGQEPKGAHGRIISLSPDLCSIGTDPAAGSAPAKVASVPLGSRDPVPYDEILRSWNEMAKATPPVPTLRFLTIDRKAKLRKRWKEWSRIKDPMAVWYNLLERIHENDWLQGKNDKKWVVNFKFVVRSEETWTRLFEGMYVQGEGTVSGHPKDDLKRLFPYEEEEKPTGYVPKKGREKTEPPTWEKPETRSQQSLLDEFRERF